jgi:serine/threonine-protein kinase HipA
MDACGVFLEELRRRAEGAELAARIRTREADFADPGLEPGSFDLLWSEGAIYQLGFEAGLRAWRPLLRAGGCLVVSEATWLTPTPPAEIRERWGQWYPAMGTVDSNLEVARAAGFEVLEVFPLPASAWWAYYDPLWANCLAAREGSPDAGMRDVIAETELELSMFRRFGHTYGYVFYVLRKGEEE